MNKENQELFHAIVNELVRIETNTNQRFDKIENNLVSVRDEVYACRLERESVSILLKKIDQLEKRVSELEQYIA